VRDGRASAAPERPIAGGLATPALLSQVLVSKYCDYTPLFRQSQIFARHGLDLPRMIDAHRMGRRRCRWLKALHERLAKDVLASDSGSEHVVPNCAVAPRDNALPMEIWIPERKTQCRVAKNRLFV
jgi:hypothetical protein